MKGVHQREKKAKGIVINFHISQDKYLRCAMHSRSLWDGKIRTAISTFALPEDFWEAENDTPHWRERERNL